MALVGVELETLISSQTRLFAIKFNFGLMKLKL